MSKVALITGGASGMGLAVAEALAKRGNWILHILDMNVERGEVAAKSLGSSAHFHKVDVTSYPSLSSTFDKIFNAEKRIDFVFANAGIVEKVDFYARHPAGGPPPEIDQLVTDICLKSVITTSYLALHYFRQSPNKGKDSNLIMTASCGGLYPSGYSPIYSAAKHGVVGLMRSITKFCYFTDGIKVDAICPGTVKTNLLTQDQWKQFPDEYFTPVETIVKAVLMLLDGGDMEDSKGIKVPAAKAYGLAVEVNGRNHYFRSQPEYCDEAMRAVMEATDVENSMYRK